MNPIKSGMRARHKYKRQGAQEASIWPNIWGLLVLIIFAIAMNIHGAM